MATTTTPRLSVFELVELFQDKPTIPLVETICDQLSPIPETAEGLIRTMFGLYSDANIKAWLDGTLTYEQQMMIDVGFSRCRNRA